MNKKEEPILMHELIRCAEKNRKYQVKQLWKYKDKTFIFNYLNENGTPLGFDYKHCILVYSTALDQWHNLIDVNDIRTLSKIKLDTNKYFFSDENDFYQQAYSFINACVKFLKLMY